MSALKWDGNRTCHTTNNTYLKLSAVPDLDLVGPYKLYKAWKQWLHQKVHKGADQNMTLDRPKN